MIKLSTYCVIHAPPRKLTLSWFSSLFLGLFCLPIVVHADAYDLNVQKNQDVGEIMNQAIENGWTGGTVNIQGNATLNNTVTNTPDFTMESDSVNAPTIKANTTGAANSAFYINDGVSHTYTFNNLTLQGNSNVTIRNRAAFIADYSPWASATALTLNLNNVTIDSFNTYTAFGHGSAIHADYSLNISGTEFAFTNNTGAGSTMGAIKASNLSITGTKMTFSGNSSAWGGAIFAGTLLSITGQDITFSENEAVMYYGGAIGSSDALTSITGTNITFASNKAKMYGGAIQSFEGCISITGTNITFSGNTAENAGGAIYSEGDNISITGTNITFSSNTAGKGGAIYSEGDNISITGTNITFASNTAGTGGAIYTGTLLSITGHDVNFTNNSHDIYFRYDYDYDYQMASNDPHATLNLNGLSDESVSETSKGTFKFNGGIDYNGDNFINPNYTLTTNITNADVTIAGRDDVANVYQLGEVTFNNGTLTANLDDIETLTGTFNLKDGSITLNKGADQNAKTATIKSTDKNGVIGLVYEAQDGVATNESLVLSSGRVDVKGCMAATVTVEANATFSPGNSVGTVTIEDGNFNLDGTLLMEIGGDNPDTENDKLIVNGNLTLGNDAVIYLALADGHEFTSGDDFLAQIVANNDSDISELLYGKIALGWPFYNLAVTKDGNVYNITGTYDPNAVPEPSTWALMILGAAALMYWRKRK